MPSQINQTNKGNDNNDNSSSSLSLQQPIATTITATTSATLLLFLNKIKNIGIVQGENNNNIFIDVQVDAKIQRKKR
ncbi:2179_t:CDS:2 [Entrophospora sp. SA101]|nr:2179_t:CDS:2 [Entrophospora sp. SA101]CAJ0848720.1 7460_t:CDS:2 [Entrophospora sp. SA101]